MLGRLRHTLVVARGLCSVTAVLWAGSGYLPTVGPLPLRFLPLPLLSSNWVSVPAPAPPALPPPTLQDMSEEEDDVSNAPQTTVIPPLADTNAASHPVIMEVSSAPANPPPQDPVISPQMLIQYFRPSTNSAAAPATGSVGFLQPTPPGAAAPQGKGTP